MSNHHYDNTFIAPSQQQQQQQQCQRQQRLLFFPPPPTTTTTTTETTTQSSHQHNHVHAQEYLLAQAMAKNSTRQPQQQQHLHFDIDPNSPAASPRCTRHSSRPLFHTTTETTTATTTATVVSSLSLQNEGRRHWTVWDLLSLGVGGTVGSGIFVLTGQIAHDYAGPATFLSWILSGLAAATSALSLCELSSRIPATGSTYVYCQHCGLGPLVAVVAAACLSLEYVVSGAAVARTWGDKVVWWWYSYTTATTTTDGGGDWGGDEQYQDVVVGRGWWLLPWNGMVNIPAMFVSITCTVLLLCGVQESKHVANFFTILKMILVLGMILGGFSCAFLSAGDDDDAGGNKNHFKPLVPPQFGIHGILRGATSSFFGYLGYDEVCVVAGEALHPTRDVPRAILGTLTIVTICYVGASLALIAMQNYQDIHPTSGFPAAFAARQWPVASQIAAAGELTTLPVVVLISLLAQPRLTVNMARDGILPSIFQRQNAHGNLIGGTLLWGIFMSVTAALVPFTYLDDLISCGILVAFCLANVCLIVLRQRDAQQQQQKTSSLLQQAMHNPQHRYYHHHQQHRYNQQHQQQQHPLSLQQEHHEAARELQIVLLIFNVLCCVSALLWSHRGGGGASSLSSTADSMWLFRLVNYTLATIMSLITLTCYFWIARLLAKAKNQPQHPAWHPNHGNSNPRSLQESDHDDYNEPSSAHHHTATMGDGEVSYFVTPWVPALPCCGMAINWYLIAQLEVSGLILLLLYLGGTVGVYQWTQRRQRRQPGGGGGHNNNNKQWSVAQERNVYERVSTTLPPHQLSQPCDNYGNTNNNQDDDSYKIRSLPPLS